MRYTGRVRALPLLRSLSFVALVGCGGAAFHMRSASSDALPSPSEGHALVVFAMPTGRTVITILDQYGVYFGQLRGGHYFTREVDPGVHRFYAVRNVEGYVLHTESLEAGRTYYVVAEDPLVQAFYLRAGRCDEDGAAIIAPLAHVERDPATSEETIRRVIGDEPMRMHEADLRWDRMDGPAHDLRTLRSCATPTTPPEPSAAPLAPE
jgi:hypothetical protein